jgi:predicted transcriptional regulator of viral defense system
MFEARDNIQSYMAKINHTSSQAKRAEAMLAERGMVRLREFTAAGIAEETLARLVRQGRVVRPARGLYRRADAKPDAAHSLAQAAALVPNGVVCLVSALQFHGLTTEMPPRIWMAIRRSTWTPTVTYPPLRFVYFGERAFAADVETHRIERVPVRLYGVAKTIVDCFRYRNKIGVDVALVALREALTRGLCSSNEIFKLARELRILTVVQPYLEATTIHGA